MFLLTLYSLILFGGLAGRLWLVTTSSGQPVRWQLDQYILESSTTRSTTEPKQVSYDVVTSIVSCQTGYQYILENCSLQLEPHSLHKKEHMGGRQTEDQYILDPGRKEASTQTDDSFSVFGFLRDTEGGCVAPFSTHHYASYRLKRKQMVSLLSLQLDELKVESGIDIR